MTASIAPAPLAPGPVLWPSRDAVPRQHSLSIGKRTIRVAPPNWRDPRIHLSSVILTILFIGVGWLGFRISIAQILITMGSCAAVELILTYRKSHVLAWPASALQTGTSTALLFRVIGTENGDYWTLHGWHWFVIVGVAGVLTKYTIRWKSGHVFNPSNVALVVAFLLLGSQRVEPLDYWWAPFGWAMAAAYLVILVGGLAICGRLKLLGLGMSLWVSLAAGLGVLAAANHSITTRYSLTPITGTHFWWIIMTSPEIMIFMFFMITDPRTVPEGRVGRIAYGITIGVVCSMFIAPWQTEFGAKVGLLAGLVVVCMARPLYDRYFPAVGSSEDHPLRYLRTKLAGRRPFVLAGTGLATIVLLAVVISVLGIPARAKTAEATTIDVAAQPIDPSTLPTVTIDPKVAGISAPLATQAGAQALIAQLAWNLSVEGEAIANGDASLLPAISDGARLQEITQRIERAGAGERVVPTYTFEQLDLTIVFPGGFQRGPNAGVRATGTVENVTLAADGTEIARASEPFATTFTLRMTETGQWLNAAILPYELGEAE